MKVRFYCDVPEFYQQGFTLFANEKPLAKPMDGYKRVAFEVDFPSEVLRLADLAAPSKFIGELPDLESAP
jgi:hypothetical protein